MNKNSVQILEQSAHGGDVQFYRTSLTGIPKGARIIEKKEEKIIARGETSGHCHILTGDVTLFEFNGQTYAAVGRDGAFHQHYKESMVTDEVFTINKNISNCDHTKECRLPKGVYAIGLDQQYDPHAGVWQANKD